MPRTWKNIVRLPPIRRRKCAAHWDSRWDCGFLRHIRSARLSSSENPKNDNRERESALLLSASPVLLSPRRNTPEHLSAALASQAQGRGTHHAHISPCLHPHSAANTQSHQHPEHGTQRQRKQCPRWRRLLRLRGSEWTQWAPCECRIRLRPAARKREWPYCVPIREYRSWQ